MNSHSMDGIQPLKPGHFLVGRPLMAYPETIIDEQPALLKRRNMCQAVIHHIWQRWSREYLQQLQSLSKWRHPVQNLQVGDVVLIRVDTPFACHWPVAMIEDTYPGQDGLVRVVLLKLTSQPSKKPTKGELIRSLPTFTYLKRPVSKVALTFLHPSLHLQELLS